jgi:hypothetical protein
MQMKFTDLYTQPAEFFNNLDTSDITVREAQNPEDRRKVLKLRERGYKMYFGSGSGTADHDKPLPNETVFLAVDQDDKPVGTLRVLDRTKGKIELDNFLDVDALLDEKEKPCAEATRFTIAKHPKGVIIKILLWRAYFKYCQSRGIRTMLISSRPIMAKNYTYLLFKEIGLKGVYRHNHLKNKEHSTYKMNIPSLRDLWIQAKHPLFKFMFVRN